MANFVQYAASNLVSSYLCHEKLEVKLSPLHADGVVARELIHVGDTVFAEKPLCFLQTIPNAQDVIVCGYCQTVLGDLEAQVGVLSKAITREDVNAKEDSCPCQAKCGVLYCSADCNSQHWNRGHKFLCTGFITEEDAPTSPLINFKIHSCATNEIFLLVADVFASICCEVERKRLEGVHDDAAIAAALFPYSTFVRNPWWEVAIPSRDGSTTDPEESPEKFAQTLRQLVNESWDMLRQVLQLDDRGLSETLSADYFARTIGMFEQNNIGVRCEHPLAAVASSLHPSSELVHAILHSAEAISNSLEEDEWVDDDGEEDDDEEEEEGDEEMDECGAESCEHDHDHHHEHAMDLVETGDEELDELNVILRDYGVDSIFPPLDGTALYSMMCKINHSCEPNVRVKYVFTKEYGLVAQLVALKEIKPDTELLQSYIDQTMDTAARQAALADYGFRCTCEKCSA